VTWEGTSSGRLTAMRLRSGSRGKGLHGKPLDWVATRLRRSVASFIIGGGDECRAPIGALDINQKRLHQSLELTKRALRMEWEQLKAQGSGLRNLGQRLGKDERDLSRVVMWIESLEWKQSWGHVLGDLKQLQQ
jgi:hypothetical protein